MYIIIPAVKDSKLTIFYSHNIYHLFFPLTMKNIGYLSCFQLKHSFHIRLSVPIDSFIACF